MNYSRTALISVVDTNGLGNFVRRLVDLGWNILATSDTAQHLKKELGDSVPICDLTDLERDKGYSQRITSETQSRCIHNGLLSREGCLQDEAELERLGCLRIDLVYVSFPPIPDKSAGRGPALSSIVADIDAGALSIIISAIKGQRIVVCEPSQLNDALRLVGDYSTMSEEERAAELLALLSDAALLLSTFFDNLSDSLNEPPQRIRV